MAGPVDPGRLAAVHRGVDDGAGAGLDLGCVYVDVGTIDDLDLRHPTWTHGRSVHRALSIHAGIGTVR